MSWYSLVSLFYVFVFKFNVTPARTCAPHVREARVTAAMMATIRMVDTVMPVSTAARRVQIAILAIRARLATTGMVTGAHGVGPLAARRVQVPVFVNRASLDTGEVHVTTCVQQGVKEVCATKMTAAVSARLATTGMVTRAHGVGFITARRVQVTVYVIRARLDTGEVHVPLCVQQGVREMFVTKMTEAVSAKKATMEVSALNNVRHRALRVLTLQTARHVRRVSTDKNATRRALMAVTVRVT